MSDFALNLCNRELVADDLPRIRQCGVRDLLDLNWYLGRAQQLHQAGFSVHQRIDVRAGLGAPEDEARDTAAKITQYGQWVETWRRRNEPNIESPGLTPEKWRLWLVAYGMVLRQLCPTARFYAPAVSPGTANWLDWLESTADAATEGHYSGLDLHAYGSPGEVARIVETVRALWSGPILWTEYNFGAGRPCNLVEYAEWLPVIGSIANQHDIQSVFLFSWEWAHPDVELPTTVNVKGTLVERALIGLAGNAERRTTGGIAGGDTVAYEYRWGIKDLAEKLGASVVGDPITDEEYDRQGNSVQFTSKGKFEYSKTANRPFFFPAVLPKA